MFVARVVGNVWATAKHPELKNHRMLLVRRLDRELNETGDAQMALCSEVDAGIGDTVLVLDEGNSARLILDNKRAPVRTVVVGIIDEILVDGSLVKF